MKGRKKVKFENKKLKEFEEYIKGKKIAIIGLGISNLPLIDYFHEKQSNVTIFDSKPIDQNILDKINRYQMEYSCRK